MSLTLFLFTTDEIQGSQEDYDTCADPANIKDWMDWQYCAEFKQASCLALVALGLDCKETLPGFVNDMPSFDILSFIRKMIFRTQVPLLCSACTFEGEVREPVRNGRKKEPIVLHTLAHLMTGGDFGDLLTSPNDPGPFYGYHANSDRNNLQWMINTEDDLEDANWGYPSSTNSNVGSLFRMAGPYPVYPALACAIQPDVFPDYSLFANQWLPGTMLDDVVNSGFPMDTLFDTPPANGWGYTHGESK